jgi:hypothetical protein
VLGVVQLDDRSHRASKRQERDEFMDRPFEEFVLDHLTSDAEMFEGDMIFHPETGEVLADQTDPAHQALSYCQSRIYAQTPRRQAQRAGHVSGEAEVEVATSAIPETDKEE